MKWWYISVKNVYIGKCQATFEQIKKACGPWCEIKGNHINIFTMR